MLDQPLREIGSTERSEAVTSTRSKAIRPATIIDAITYNSAIV